MKIRILLLLGCAAWSAAAQEASCRTIESERIRIQDLAAILPEFATVAPETLLAQAPLPGSQRIFHAGEITALAHRFGVTLAAAKDACFEWEMKPLDRERALAAMQESLQNPEAQIEIADLITARVPAGRIEFPTNRLGTPASQDQRAPVLWRGDVIYGEGRRFAIWARVGITTQCRRLVALNSLRAGQPIEPSQVRATTVSCFPTATSKEIPAPGDVAGMVLLRAVTAGSELKAEFLVAANDINRGDTVRVEVRSGAARLALSVKALTGGRSGETISVRNPESNRIFQARVTGKGTAIVDAGTIKGS